MVKHSSVLGLAVAAALAQIGSRSQDPRYAREREPEPAPPEPTKEMRERVMHVFDEATRMAVGMKIGGKAAVRRVLGNADWRSDPERFAAAEAKRARRRARSGGASS